MKSDWIHPRAAVQRLQGQLATLRLPALSHLLADALIGLEDRLPRSLPSPNPTPFLSHTGSKETEDLKTGPDELPSTAAGEIVGADDTPSGPVVGGTVLPPTPS